VVLVCCRNETVDEIEIAQHFFTFRVGAQVQEDFHYFFCESGIQIRVDDEIICWDRFRIGNGVNLFLFLRVLEILSLGGSPAIGKISKGCARVHLAIQDRKHCGVMSP